MYSDKTKEYWDSLQSKEELYNEFEKMSSADELAVTGTDPDLPIYYKDGEFKAVADSVKDHVEKVLAVLPDVCQHFAEGVDDIIKKNELPYANASFRINRYVIIEKDGRYILLKYEHNIKLADRIECDTIEECKKHASPKAKWIKR